MTKVCILDYGSGNVGSVNNLIKFLDYECIISNNPEFLLQSTISKSNIQNYFSAYSKSQEREADLFAVERLNELQISTKGLVEFLRYLEKESYKKGHSKENFMFTTHPNYDDRFNIISSFSNKNIYNKLD